MKILIYSPDDVPNVALMKLSRYHKERGDIVYPLNAILWNNEADKIYVSSIFTNNAKKTPAFPKEKTEYGGVGFDFVELPDGTLKRVNFSKLPEEIEHLKPDYELYGLNYSMGFTSRGCIRKCPWCVVPELEGKIRPTNDIYEFYEPFPSKKIRILDNNPLALPDHFCKIASQILKEDLYVIFDGLDARVLNDDTAKALSKLKTIGSGFKFALDDYKYIEQVERGIELILKYNFLDRVLIYILLDFGETIEQELERISVMLKYNVSMYPMFYNNKWAEIDKLLKHAPDITILPVRTDSAMIRKLNRYLAYKLGLYDKHLKKIDMEKLHKIQQEIYIKVGRPNGKWIGRNELKKRLWGECKEKGEKNE